MGLAAWFGVGGTASAVAADLAASETSSTIQLQDRPAQRFASNPRGDLDEWRALISSTTSDPGRVSRREALSVPSVRRARDLICATIGGLGLQARNGSGEQVEHALLGQPESALGIVRSVTVTRTAEDLLFDGAGLWLVLGRTSAGFPSSVERVEVANWQQDPTTRAIRVNGRDVDPGDLILFASPNDPLLTTGARAIKALIALEQTAAEYAQNPEATFWFSSRDGIDPDDDDTQALVNAWQAARRRRAVAYVPAAYQLDKAPRMTPEELELMSARQHAVLEVARLTGIDAEELSVSTTSRTYANTQDRRRAFVDFTLGPLIHAIEERLSLGDVTPRGQQVRFNLSSFLRSDDLTRMQTYEIGLRVGAYTQDEVRALEGRPPLEGQK